jgi:hypothetical protein
MSIVIKLSSKHINRCGSIQGYAQFLDVQSSSVNEVYKTCRINGTIRSTDVDIEGVEILHVEEK